MLVSGRALEAKANSEWQRNQHMTLQLEVIFL